MTSNSKPKWANGFLDSSEDDMDIDNEEPEKDYYKILGVNKSCSQDEIVKAYRKKSKKIHPDMHRDEKEKYKKLFQELGEAYSILKDPKKRDIYNRFGEKGVKKRNFFIPKSENDLNMLFKMAFEDEVNKNDKHAYSSKPQCPPIQITQPIRKAYIGEMASISYKKRVICRKCLSKAVSKCNSCGGQGKKSNSLPGVYRTIEAVCQKCHGTSYDMNQNFTVKCSDCVKGIVHKTVWGAYMSEKTCSKCNGSGTYCDGCSNKGFDVVEVDKLIKIKKKNRNCWQQVLYKEGHEVENYATGDVVITFKIVE